MKIILFLIAFITTFLIYYISVVMQTKKYNKFKKGSQIKFFEKKYGLKFKNITEKKFFTLLALIYSLIISITLVIVSLIKGLLIQLILAIIIMIPLLLLSYKILGNYIRKKEL